MDWRTPRSTDNVPQLFWFDHLGRLEAAVLATDWGDRIALDPIVMPDVPPDWVAHVMNRGLAHAAEAGFGSIGLEVDCANAVLREILVGHGFYIEGDGVVEAWLAADARLVISPLHEDYRLSSRLDTMLGIDLLAAAGATRIKICFEPDNQAARNLYLSVGLEPMKQTVIFARRSDARAS